ncbi:aldo/keto reductase [Lactovum miscens]|nr:aldo/keto reductase [Lactovum miscens]
MKYISNINRYGKMSYRRVGSSGLLLPEISLGLWHNFGSLGDFENARDMLRTAFDNGITHFDLANNYGPEPGSAEINFGKIFHEDFENYRDELIISTKAGHLMWPGPYGDWGSRKSILASLDQSLERMNLNYVDIFYSHRPDPSTPIEETMGALKTALDSGKALYVGITKYNANQTKMALSVADKLGFRLLIHQTRYSIFNRGVEAELLDELENEKIGAIAFQPLSQGMLTDKYLNGIPEDSRIRKPGSSLKEEDMTEERLVQIRQLNDIARSRGQSLAQMAISWVLKKRPESRSTPISSALIGASSSKQILENLQALDKLEFSADELFLIDQISLKL